MIAEGGIFQEIFGQSEHFLLCSTVILSLNLSTKICFLVLTLNSYITL